ncbi:hypothetical protein AGMMS49944_30740 [Spirochaetia bacterium]|nr:hypothetical protein AGMMS49944_30740 [Spirochaetia bacterium]
MLVHNTFAIDITVGHYSGITLTDNKLKYEVWEENDDSNTEEYDITWETINQISYIRFNYTGNFLGNKVEHGLKRYLVLYSEDYIFLFDEKNKAVCQYFNRAGGVYETPSKAQSTSELREGNIVYKANNVVKQDELSPWVEGKSGSGIGEKIRISQNTENIVAAQSTLDVYRYWGIIISNGFIDYNKPYLYEYNNRVKKIRVSRGNPNEYVDIDIEDTPQFQYFEFQDALKTESNILEIEILEVYRGTRYDDTCINMIIPWGSHNF